MKRHRTSGNWIAGSMTGGTRRLAAVLSAVALALVLVLSGVTYSIGVGWISTAPVRSDPPITATESTADEQVAEGAELIADDAVPMAAAPTAQETSKPVHPPVVLLLGVGVGAAAVSLVMRIRRIDASIRTMEDSDRQG